MFTYETFTIRKNERNVEFRIGDSSVILTPKVAKLIAEKIAYQIQKIERENNEDNTAK